MARFLCELDVRLRHGVLDPSGEAVGTALRQLGHQVGDVRMGKLIELEVEAGDEAAARSAVTDMARSILVNPVLEDFTLRVQPR